MLLWLERLGCRSLTIAGALAACACGAPAHQNPMAEYLAGINDAIDRQPPRQLPTIVVTWNPNETAFGECRRIAGEPVIYVHMGRILGATSGSDETRALVEEVATHELGHAALTCSNADHAVLPPPSLRTTIEPPRIVARPAWELGERAER